MVKRLLLCVSLVLMTGACAESTRVDVTRFTVQPGGFMGRTFSVYADPTQSGNLEFQSMAATVGSALQAHGLVVEPPNTPSDLVVEVHYASKDPHVKFEEGPYFGWYHRHGPWGYPGQYTDSITLYTQLLEVDIFDGPSFRQGKPQMVYQGHAVGESRINDINTSSSYLIAGLLSDFPGPSGVTEQVWVPIKN